MKFLNSINRYADPVAPFLFVALIIHSRHDLISAVGFFAAFCYACKVASKKL